MNPEAWANVARALGPVARAHGLWQPAYRTPPRKAGENRTLRRLPADRDGTGRAVLYVLIANRADADVVADMIDGTLVANGRPLDDAVRGPFEDVARRVLNPEAQRALDAERAEERAGRHSEPHPEPF